MDLGRRRGRKVASGASVRPPFAWGLLLCAVLLLSKASARGEELAEVEAFNLRQGHSRLVLAHHHQQLAGRIDGIVAKFPGPDALRPFEGRIDRAVGSALDVDPLAHVDAWVAALGFSLLRVILHEGEVVLAVARDHPVEILAQLHAPLLLRDQFQVHVQLRVGVEARPRPASACAFRAHVFRPCAVRACAARASVACAILARPRPARAVAAGPCEGRLSVEEVVDDVIHEPRLLSPYRLLLDAQNSFLSHVLNEIRKHLSGTNGSRRGIRATCFSTIIPRPLLSNARGRVAAGDPERRVQNYGLSLEGN